MQILQERFEAWLFSQPRDRFIAYNNPEKCFVCTFLKESTNQHPIVFWQEWVPNPSLEQRQFRQMFIKLENTQPLPLWVQKLVVPCMSYIRSLGPDGYATMSCGELQDRYISLFGDPRLKAEPVQIEATQTIPELQPA